MGARKTEPRRIDLKPILTGTAAPLPSNAREGQTVAGDSLLARYVNFVKLPHTVFALPFALLGVIYASRAHPVTLEIVALVIIAFTAARFAAMGFNRIVDRDIDRENPRTRNREIPSGKLTVTQAAWAVGVSAAIFFTAAGLLNPICALLSPLAMAWILGYSYTKRFTSLSHLWLGGALAIAPVGGYLAVAGAWSTPAWTLLTLSAAVLLWVAGFDIFYSLQDEPFDRTKGLRSAVVKLGARGSIMIAKLFHYIMIALLVLFAYGAGWGPAFGVSVVVAAAFLLWEHRLVKPDDLSRIDTAFFTINGVISLIIFGGALVDRLL